MDEYLKIAFTKLENYIEAKLAAAVDQIIKYTTTIFYNVVQPQQTKKVQYTANTTAKRLWNKRVHIVPLRNSLEIMVNNLRDELRQDLGQIISETLPRTLTPLIFRVQVTNQRQTP